MSSYVFELSDISIANGDNTLHINNSDSVFGAIPGSMLWIDSYRPRFVQSVDNTARTVTLTANWDGEAVINKPATIAPLTSFEQQKQAVDSVNSVTNSARNLLDRFLGLEANYNKYLDDKYNGLKTLINGSMPFETVNELTAYGEPISQGHENNDVLAIVWNDTKPEYNGMYGWSGLAWVKSTYDLMADVKTSLAVREAVSELRTDLLSRGIGNGETGDPSLLAAFSTEAMERTWLEVAKDTLGPSALAIARIVAPLVVDTNFIQSMEDKINEVTSAPLSLKASNDDLSQAVESVNAEISSAVVDLKSDILKRGVGQGETGNDEILAAFTTEAMERTWLEVAKDTLGPSALAIARIIAPLVDNPDFLQYMATIIANETEEPLNTKASNEDLSVAIGDLKTDILQRGVGQGPTNIDDVLLAFTTETLERTWLEVTKDTLGPTDYAADLIAKSLASNDEFIQAVDAANSELNADKYFESEELAFSFTFESLERTWLEIAKNGGLTDYAAKKVTQSLKMDQLTDEQLHILGLNLDTGGSVGTIQVSSSPLPISPSTAPQGPGREYPTVIKNENNPIFLHSDQSAASIFWAWMVDMRQDGGEGVALFWSTDHAGHSYSGTFLATASRPDAPAAEWTHHGMVFRDDITGGEQHETPTVEWDEVNSRWLQYYQLKNVPGYVGQVTLIATAPRILKENLTPETWTPLGIAFAENYTFNAGSGDSTYVKTYRFDKRWEAHSLYGGGSTRRAHWTSPDGINWTLNPNIMEFQQHLIDHLPGFNYENWIIKTNSGAHVIRNGQLWLICPVGEEAGGGIEIPIARICAFRVGSDGVTFGRAIDITPPLQTWEDPVLGVDQFGSAITWDNKVYVSYRAGGGTGGFGIMEVL